MFLIGHLSYDHQPVIHCYMQHKLDSIFVSSQLQCRKTLKSNNLDIFCPNICIIKNVITQIFHK